MNLANLSNLVTNSPQWLRYVLILIVGMAIGAVFYPTKNIEEKLRVQYEQKISEIKETNKKTVATLTENLTKTQSSKKQLEVTTSSKIAKLTIENSQLKSKKTETYYKIVHPDGTIEVRDVKASEVDQSNQVITSVKQEFDQKVKDLESKYSAIHLQRVQQIQQDFSKKEEKYQETIASLQKDKSVQINPKSFGVEAGLLTNKDYYGHVTYDIFGPIFLGLHGQFGPTDTAGGVGLGIRF